jgi:putative flippase GtrA
MKKIITRYKHLVPQFFKFGLVGTMNTVVSYSIYFTMVFFDIHYLGASVTAFFISVANSFFWNNKYVFKKADGQKRSTSRALMKTYASYALTGLGLYNLMLFILIEKITLSKYIAPFFATAVIVPLNFFLNRQWAFKTAKSG